MTVLPYISMNRPKLSTCPLHPEPPPTSLPIPLGCPGAPPLGALFPALNVHWSFLLHVLLYIVVFQSLSRFRLFAAPWTAACQAPCPSLSPRACSNSCLLSQWCHSKYLIFGFGISPSSEYSGLISFRIDWFVLLAVQGTLKSLLQHYSSKA